MNSEYELKKLAEDFRKIYNSLCKLEVISDLPLTEDSKSKKEFLKLIRGEFIEVLEIYDLEKGILIGIRKIEEQEYLGKFPSDIFHYDLASSNPYLDMIKIFTDNLDLLHNHLKQNPVSSIFKMFACVGLLEVTLENIFKNEIKIKGPEFLLYDKNFSLGNLTIKMFIRMDDNKNFLKDFSKFLISELANYPFDLKKSPRSDSDLLKLEDKDKNLLYGFYYEVIEKSINYLYDSENDKPYYMQILMRSLRNIYLEYAHLIDWKFHLANFFLSDLIIPYLKNPPSAEEILSPREKKISPRPSNAEEKKVSPRPQKPTKAKTPSDQGREQTFLKMRRERYGRTSVDLTNEVTWSIYDMPSKNKKDEETVLLSPKQSPKRSSPRSQKQSPRSPKSSPRLKEKRNSISEGMERWRNSLSGSFHNKMKKVDLKSSMGKEELEKYFSDIADLLSNILEESLVTSDEYLTEEDKKNKYRRFVIINFVDKLYDPLAPRPVSLTDYYHESEQIYKEIMDAIKTSDQENKEKILEDLKSLDVKKPSRYRCLKILEYLKTVLKVQI